MIFEEEIKDSGERRDFGTGAVRDMGQGKGRCDLMPLDVVETFIEQRFPINQESFFSNIDRFKESGLTEVNYLYNALLVFTNEYYSDIDIKNRPSEALLDAAKQFEGGALKYGDNNWQKGIPARVYIDSSIRHYLKYKANYTDEPHPRAVIWNLICCIWTVVHCGADLQYIKMETPQYQLSEAEEVEIY